MIEDVFIDVEKLEKFLRDRDVLEVDIMTATKFSASSMGQYLKGHKYSELFFRRLADHLGLTSYEDFLEMFEIK